jgi:hypothetical protein
MSGVLLLASIRHEAPIRETVESVEQGAEDISAKTCTKLVQRPTSCEKALELDQPFSASRIEAA